MLLSFNFSGNKSIKLLSFIVFANATCMLSFLYFCVYACIMSLLFLVNGRGMMYSFYCFFFVVSASS